MADKPTESNVMALPQTIERPRATPTAEVLESIFIHGDLSKLNPSQEVDLIKRLCAHLGISPLTRPFIFLTLQGKRIIYATRDCAEQLRKVNGISVVETREQEMDGVYIVTSKLRDASGREDIARGAVDIKGKTGEVLANLIMKAETKSKRRGTLSISGLGFMDETEIESVQAIEAEAPKRGSGRSKDGRITSYAAKKAGSDWPTIFNEIVGHIGAAPDTAFLDSMRDTYAQELKDMPTAWMKLLCEVYDDKWSDLGGDPMDNPMRPMEERG